jgi:hypothetical protein
MRAFLLVEAVFPIEKTQLCLMGAHPDKIRNVTTIFAEINDATFWVCLREVRQAQ